MRDRPYDNVGSPPTYTEFTIAAAQAGDSKALDQVVRECMNLIKDVASRFKFRSLEREDIYGFGVVGLITAIYAFDKHRNVPFQIWAKVQIQKQIRMAYEAYGKLVRLPSHKVYRELEEVVEYQDDSMKLRQQELEDIRPLLSCLTAIERSIIVRYFGLDGDAPRPAIAIADQHGWSRYYIELIVKEALEKMNRRARFLNRRFNECYN